MLRWLGVATCLLLAVWLLSGSLLSPAGIVISISSVVIGRRDGYRREQRA